MIFAFQSTETSPASSLHSLPISPCSEKSLPFKVILHSVSAFSVVGMCFFSTHNVDSNTFFAAEVSLVVHTLI